MADNLEGAPKPTLLSGMGKTHIVLPASFLMSASHGLITFGMVYYLRDAYGASAAVIGRFTAFYSLSYLAGCLLLKPLLSSLLPRRSMMISSAVMGTSVAGILLIRSLDSGFLLYGLFGFSIALFWPPLMGWLSAEREGPELTRTMGRFNLAWSSANVAAPLLAGLLFDIGPVLPIAAGIAAVFAVFFFVLAAALVLPRFRADTYREPRSREEAGPENRTPVRHIARLGVFSSYAMLGVLSTMFPLFGRENLLVSAGTVGALLLTRALATTAGFVFFGRLHGWHFRTAPHFLTQAAFAGMALLLVLTPSVTAYIVVLPLFGFAAAYSYSSSLFHGAAGTPRRGRSMTIHEIVLNLGQILGAFGGGMFFQAGGMRGTLLFMLALFLLCGTAQAAVAVRTREAAARL